MCIRDSLKTKSTLIVFVTPQIIRSAEDVKANLDAILAARQELMQSEFQEIFGNPTPN